MGARLDLTYFLDHVGAFLLLFHASSRILQQEMRLITITNLTILQQLLQVANFTFVKVSTHTVTC